MSKETAVQWLENSLSVVKENIPEWYLPYYESAFKLALQLEREQILDAYWDGGQNMPMNIESCNNYYTQTFKPNE